MKIIADKDIPFLAGVLEPFAEVVYLRGDAIGPADVRDADAILTRTRTRCNSALLEGSRVRFIGTATIGFDHIDMPWCAANGIRVTTAAGCNARGVLQWVSAVLAQLVERQNRKVAGESEPSGMVLGVVGVGNVGSLVAKYAADWGFRVMKSDPPRERAEGLGEKEDFYPLDEIVAAADVMTFHVPLTADGPDATKGMVGREFLAATKPNAVILNSSRGPVLQPGVEGRRFIIDTWNGEPNIDLGILERVLLGTPHIAGYSQQGKAMATAMIVRALASEFGLPLAADWYPERALRSVPREIDWKEMCTRMPQYFDIAAESALLKAEPERFEEMRDNYKYREEFF